MKFSPVLAILLATIPAAALGQENIVYKNSQLTLIDSVEIASLDQGVVKKVHVRAGQRVDIDSILIDLDQDIFKAEANAAAIDFAIAKQQFKSDVNLRFAEKSVAVNEKQLKKSLDAVDEFSKSISETEIDRLRLERDQSVLSTEQAELEREIAKLTMSLREQQKQIAEFRLHRRSIRSPIKGAVVEVMVQAGESASPGQAIARIVRLDKLKVKAVFPAKYALVVSKDCKSFFELLRDGKTVRFPAKIVFISPEVSPTEQVFEIWAELDNHKGTLLPGFKGSFSIELKLR